MRARWRARVPARTACLRASARPPVAQRAAALRRQSPPAPTAPDGRVVEPRQLAAQAHVRLRPAVDVDRRHAVAVRECRGHHHRAQQRIAGCEPALELGAARIAPRGGAQMVLERGLRRFRIRLEGAEHHVDQFAVRLLIGREVGGRRRCVVDDRAARRQRTGRTLQRRCTAGANRTAVERAHTGHAQARGA